MCRSIKVLRKQEPNTTQEEIRAAALQFVRKISGYRQPSKANTPAFNLAVKEIAVTSTKLLGSMQTVSRVISRRLKRLADNLLNASRIHVCGLRPDFRFIALYNTLHSQITQLVENPY
jgi:hypothetical protein